MTGGVEQVDYILYRLYIAIIEKKVQLLLASDFLGCIAYSIASTMYPIIINNLERAITYVLYFSFQALFVQFDASSYTIAEGEQANLLVLLNTPSYIDVAVDVSTIDGTAIGIILAYSYFIN